MAGMRITHAATSTSAPAADDSQRPRLRLDSTKAEVQQAWFGGRR
jgi:hypothetical protein